MHISAVFKKINLRRNWPFALAALVVVAGAVIWLSWPDKDAKPLHATVETTTVQMTTTAETAAPTPTPAPTATPAPTPTPGMPQLMEMNLLTGQRLDEPVSAQDRPLAVMINNTNKALPQIGIAAADIIYEMEVEGGITRLMAIFPNAASVPPELGSIRSARHNYLDVACGLDALLVHVGGSFIAKDQIRDMRIATIDMHHVPGYFWRDQEWMDKRGYAHSVKTSGELMQKAVERIDMRTIIKDPASVFSFRHPDLFVPADGPVAEYAYVPFSNHTQAEFFYDEESNEYSKHQFGQPHLDMAVGRAVSFTNVILLQTDVRVINKNGHINADLRAGTGYYLSGGHYQEITWEKGDTYDRLQLFAADGSTLQVNVGKSYIGVVSDKRTTKLTATADQN